MSIFTEAQRAALKEASRSAKAREVERAFARRGSIRMRPIDPEEYPPIKGLEGPFQFRSGRVLYYDPREGRYYDRETDMYLKRDFDPMHESALSEAATTKKLDRAEYGEMVPLKVGGRPFTFERVASGFHVYVGTYTDDFKGKLPEPITSRPLLAAKAIALAKKQG
jgi:hypothetical protein